MEMTKSLRVLFTAVAIIGFTLYGYGEGGAALVTFSGADPGAGPGDSRPSSDEAAVDFDAAAGALGSVNLVTFEALSTGFNTSFMAATGVTVTFGGGYDSTSFPSLIGVTTNSSTPETLGYNTTSGGTNFLGFTPLFATSTVGVTATLTWAFDNPVLAFGGYVTGLESGIAGKVNITFNDGSFTSLNLADLSGGGVEFLGFTDSKPISSVVFVETIAAGKITRDIWGIDDVRYVFASVPEAGALLLFGTGLIGLVGYRRSRRMQ